MLSSTESHVVQKTYSGSAVFESDRPFQMAQLSSLSRIFL